MTKTLSFMLFDTTIGRCGIVWSRSGIVGLQLPEANEAATRVRLRNRFPGACEMPAPAAVLESVDAIVRLLRGHPSDLSTITLDMDSIPPFHRRVYEAARAVPPGATVTYGEIARQIGSVNTARAVGQALRRNPLAIIVPCHRVLAAGGKVGGFSGSGGITTKLRLLAIEAGQANTTPDLFGDALVPGFDACAAVDHLRRADAALARVIDVIGPFHLQLKNTPSVFSALAEAIVYQQLTGKAAATIFARVCALFPHAHHGLTAERILRAPDEKLRAAGLSAAKLLALRDLAQRSASGELPTLSDLATMDNEEIIERLTTVRGIGRWTVEMLLIFRLGRPDVLPLDDYGIRKGFAVAFGKRKIPERKTLEKHAARWKPYRSVASWYLWRAADQPKLLAEPGQV